MKRLIMLAMASMPLYGIGQTMTEWKDMEVNEINRLPLHTPIFPLKIMKRHTMT